MSTSMPGQQLLATSVLRMLLTMRVSRWLLWGSCVLAVAFAGGTYVLSPARVPSHFALGGAPDRFGDAATLLGIWLLTILGLTAMFAGIPWLLRRSPSRWINLPNKDYWLAPEHLEEACAKMEEWSNWFGAANNAFFTAVIVLTYLASQTTPVRLAEGPFLLALVTFLGFTVLWLVKLYRAYRVPEQR